MSCVMEGMQDRSPWTKHVFVMDNLLSLLRLVAYAGCALAFLINMKYNIEDFLKEKTVVFSEFRQEKNGKTRS